jgi:Zn-dependent protease
VSTVSPQIIRTCRSCGRELPPAALACADCHALVHTIELEQLASDARTSESSGNLRAAREQWSSSLALVPQDSKQADWIRNKIRTLDATSIAPTPPTRGWARKLGPLGPIAVVLAKSKGLLLAIFKLKFLLSFFAFFAVYWALFGWKFGLGFAVAILIHETGHFIDIKRRGLPAEMPVFLPGLGAYVRWQALGVPLRVRAQVSLAGPLAGWIAAGGCLVLYQHTHSPLWAALARTGAVLNILNLIPVWMLDGGQAVLALARNERLGLLAATLALWLVTGEGIFFLVTIGVTWRLFTRDLPTQPSWPTLAYYVLVLSLLAAVLHATPVTPAAPI